MNLDVRSDESAEPHWYIGHGKLSEMDEEGRKVFREFFAEGHSLKKAVSLMVNQAKFEDQDWELAEMLNVYRDWETDRKSTRLNSSH